MIRSDKIKMISRKKKVPPTTVERDYIQNYFLKSLFSKTDSLIFKGGTSIRKAFIQDYRFSDDLDFTMKTRMDQEDIRVMIEDIKDYLKREEAISFEDEVQLKEVKTGWKVNIRYTSILSQNTLINLILDVTDVDKEVIVTGVEKRALINPYSDGLKADLITYSLKEITLEKLRALCDRGWPRDLYDVYNLWPIVEKDDFKVLFSKKCKIKNVNPSIEKYRQNKEKIKSAWNKSLKHQLKTVPDFDKCFKKVINILTNLRIG